jgi:HAD superfamily hydrolase (TIGR01509 family)
MTRAVIFDIDGTLLASNDAHAHSWVDAFSDFGYSVPFYQLRWLIGMGGDRLIKTLFPGMSSSEGIGKVISHRRGSVFLERYAPLLVATPGARDLVLRLQDAGLKTVIATSAKQAELQMLLEHAGVKDLLTEATTASDVDASKPAPDVVQSALDKVGVCADDAIMIGDTPYDVDSARRAGVSILCVRSGGWDDDSLEGAAAVYDHPEDLLARFDESPLAGAL